MGKLEEGGCWYFSRKEIEENSPSRQDGIDLKKEAYLRKSYCTFLQDFGMRLKVPQVTIATAIIFCHRFFLRQSHAKNDRRTIATVCMFLAGKVEETPRPLKDVILVSYEIIHKKDPEAVQRIKQKEVYEQQKEIILHGERVVLATLGFDLNLLHPYKPLVDAIKKFKVAQNALAQVAWNFVNDGLRTSLCLQFKPHHIAAGAIFLAAKFLKVKLPSDAEKVWWQEFDVTPRQLEEVSNQMLELYEQNRVPPSANSEAEGSIVGGTSHRATSKASSSNEEHVAPNNHSQTGGISTILGNSNPMSRPVHEQPLADSHGGPPRTSQNHGSYHGSAEMRSASDHNMDGEPKDDLPYEIETLPSQGNFREGQTLRRALDGLGNEDLERNVARSEIKDSGESKDKHFGRIGEHREGTFGQSPQDAIKKIDRDKVKAALEKRKKSRGDMTRKTYFLDDDDLIERELEDGIELAAESEKNKHDRRQSWSKPLDREEYENLHHGKTIDARDEKHHGMRGQLSQKPDLNNIEDGELPAPDDMDQGFPLPKLINRKHKASSPRDRKFEGKHRNDNVPGSHHYNHHDYTDDRNRMNRLGYMERDHKRHVPENHA
ncbi:PREDICTED: cyclin-T1-3-like isoform X2 [Populus euphratica]|uniref:B-like cyclin n=1 Tax=Populus euphratica TaxID=75702 RepID=A0AAJ6TI83_POPEU|nr:PREDICTED: cyclin-T1-3-like isoform X2 [Populus euphratica]